MKTDIRRPRFQASVAVLIALMACACLAGGTARANVAPLIFLRPVMVACLFTFLVLPQHTPDWRLIRAPLLLLGAFALSMLLQLIPLPPAVWTWLPGHTLYSEGLATAGLTAPWLPISIAPDLTFNALLALLVPVAALIGAATLDAKALSFLIWILIAAVSVSALLGVVQISGIVGDAAYMYHDTDQNVPVGFMSNRNHQAVWLAATLPLVWSVARRHRPGWQWAVCAMLALLLAFSVLTTGSRAGLAALVLAVPGTVLALPMKEGRSQRWIVLGGLLAALGVIAIALIFGRAFSIDRLLDAQNYSGDYRFRTGAVLQELVWRFFPFGSGQGTFDAIYRTLEPDRLLRRSYFNHAHDDYLETLITGGVPALVVLLAAIGWVGRQTWRAFRTLPARSDIVHARLGAIVFILFGLSSIADYPVRVPLVDVVLAIAAVWLARAPRPGTHAQAMLAIDKSAGKRIEI